MNIQRTLEFGASTLRLTQVAALGAVAYFAFLPTSIPSRDINWTATPATLVSQLHSDADWLRATVTDIYSDQRACIEKVDTASSGRPIVAVQGSRGLGDNANAYKVTSMTEHTRDSC